MLVCINPTARIKKTTFLARYKNTDAWLPSSVGRDDKVLEQLIKMITSASMRAIEPIEENRQSPRVHLAIERARVQCTFVGITPVEISCQPRIPMDTHKACYCLLTSIGRCLQHNNYRLVLGTDNCFLLELRSISHPFHAATYTCSMI